MSKKSACTSYAPDEPKPDPPSENPFTNPADRYEGTSDERLTSMTAWEVREYCRYWDWCRWTATDSYSGWWCSKAVSRAKRELERRGMDRDCW